ncbi:RHS domain-containing protein [Rothia aeria]|uniref:RHS domain-containing protein n=1 Tax=Rothia aeria TaxID=172042 RepID=UPI0028CFE9C9|nr:RHS domain-containing protein [Rothia aeria]
MCGTHVLGFCFSDDLYQIQIVSPNGNARLLFAEVDSGCGIFSNWSAQLDRNGRHIRLSKERQNKLAWTSTDPKHTHFVWDGTRLLQEYTYKGHYTYICANQDSCEPLAPVHNRTNAENENRQQTYYFHCDQISIPKEMTGIHGNLLWYGDYTAWDRLKEETRVNGYRIPTLPSAKPVL